ncbi:hypothetical protein PLESTB_001231800 [Pleodorina starrii]|uniref:Uncharacterized protein n=1 Tax=Pleodorina starrii TaxID=330485 RepID=A0A9W6BSX0_9CHLO|nr:hypothetical protein PLESTM_000227800 [Pleodorina starrii]GLC57483.1 hypothetical protein PLESTB_001231800 [Pleodorina starrii]GLC63157.1 hypothetical protein PLESTF_000006000 [Pleodorina starrii]
MDDDELDGERMSYPDCPLYAPRDQTFTSLEDALNWRGVEGQTVHAWARWRFPKVVTAVSSLDTTEAATAAAAERSLAESSELPTPFDKWVLPSSEELAPEPSRPIWVRLKASCCHIPAPLVAFGSTGLLVCEQQDSVVTTQIAESVITTTTGGCSSASSGRFDADDDDGFNMWAVSAVAAVCERPGLTHL